MLEIDHIQKVYPNGVHALRDVSLTIGAGIFGLLGPNGAGKSSLMRTLATLQSPDSGTVRLDGQDLLQDVDHARRRIGYLPQDFGLYPKVTARALLDQFALYKGIRNAGERRDKVSAYLRMVNLEAHQDRDLGGFSGGMRQRFGIAQALIGSPRLLIVDEPTAGLDPAERVRLQGLLADLARDRVVLLSTHIVEDVMALCTRIAVMNAGGIVCQGDPQALIDDLQGRVWMREVGSDADIDPSWRVISSRVARGRRQVRVLADEVPGGVFVADPADLNDVYFAALAPAAAVH